MPIMNKPSDVTPGKAHFVELQQADLESVDAEHETSIGREEVMRRSRRRTTYTVLQGVNIAVVGILRRISQTLQIYKFWYSKPYGSGPRAGRGGGRREGEVDACVKTEHRYLCCCSLSATFSPIPSCWIFENNPSGTF